MRIGLVVNPIAGVGGRLGLKGSDDLWLLATATGRRAPRVSRTRAKHALAVLASSGKTFELLACPSEMGQSAATDAGLDTFVVRLPRLSGDGRDTTEGVVALLAAGAEVLVVAGGDGTLRDVARASPQVPVVAVPAGVKMYSEVFARSPQAAGGLLARLTQMAAWPTWEAEVLDIDEDAYRLGRLDVRLFGTLRVPVDVGSLQGPKARRPAGWQGTAGIARELGRRLSDGDIWIVGPGTTTRDSLRHLGVATTLLGVDVLQGRRLVACDVSERELLDVVHERPAGLILSPTGGQGFLLGRGNQQISPDVLRSCDRSQLLVVATLEKLATMRGRPLLVDTGDKELDQSLVGPTRVIVGDAHEVVYAVSD